MSVRGRIAQWLDAHASPAWRDWHKLHSSWTALFWFLFYGFLCSLTAWAGTTIVQEHPVAFTAICMFSTLTWGVARLTKQPGTHDVE